MNNHFNVSRFGRVFRKHTTEHINWYLMATAVLVGGMSLVLGFLAYMQQDHPIDPGQQNILFTLGLLGAGSVFTSTVFAHLGDKKTAMAALTLPASHFEKYLVGWLYSFLIFILVYTVSFYLVTIIILNLDNKVAQPAELLNIFSADKKVYLIFLFYAFVHAVAIWGSLFFEKLHFIKTAFAFFILFLLLIMFNFRWLETLFNRDLGMAVPFGNIGFHGKDKFYSVTLPQDQKGLISLVPVLLAIIFWFTAYFRLKEKQI